MIEKLYWSSMSNPQTISWAAKAQNNMYLLLYSVVEADQPSYVKKMIA